MRTRIVLSVLLVFVVAFFLFIKPNAKENNIQLAAGLDTFRIGAIDNGWVKDDYTNIIDLGLNLWHKYSEIDSGWQRNISVQGDIRETTDGGYTTFVNTKIGTNYSYGFLTMLDRCKINYLGLAKRSVYECEKNTQDPDYWFYGYSTHDSTVSVDLQDNTQFGNGIYVRHASPSLGHTAGYVVKGLMANREQLWMRASTLQNLLIYILPRIRIDTSGYQYTDTTSVCRIDILKSDSSIAKRMILRKSHFARKDFTYNGEYVDKYKFNPAYLEEVEPITIDSIGVLNVNNYWIDNQNCKVDYRVYWYGQCEMWLDNITVENEIAYNFFRDNPDSIRYLNFKNWLDWEVRDIAIPNESKSFNFHFDEPEFCSLPALAKINREIKSRGGTNIRVVPLFGYYMLKAHIPNFNNYEIAPEKIKKYVFDSLDIAIFNFDNYPFNGYQDINGKPISKVPNTLKDTLYSEMTGFLAESIPPGDYDNWLQNFLDKESPVDFTGNLMYANTIGKRYGISFIPCLQAHLNCAGDGKLKEPSNEELALMTNLAISYGAKGIEYFAYIGYGDLPVPPYLNPNYCRGLVNGGDNPRIYNVYGQAKWDSTKALIQKIKVWAPYLVSFNNTSTNSYIYRNQTERNSLYNNSCFTRFVSLRPGSGQTDCNEDYVPEDIPTGWLYDCQYKTFLQIATFETDQTNTYYFMVVNRRCSPYVNDDNDNNKGGKRKIRAYLHSDYPAFTEYEKWKIINLFNNSFVSTFYKSNPGYIDLGYYMPGEGNLYKIVPD